MLQISRSGNFKVHRMQNHLELTDTEFEAQFESRTFSPKLFTHEAHLRLAWIHIQKYGVETAIENIRAQLTQFVNSIGAADKYNETVTVAAIRAVYHFMLRSATDTFEKFIIENPQLKTSFKELIRTHYQTDIFTSEPAKRNYLEPELSAFD